MAIGSNVNPNYPIPGIDQSSRGFRDNFSATKLEIENLQGKNIVLVGDAIGSALIDGGPGDVIINTVVSVANVAAGGSDRTIQYNDAGRLNGDTLLYWAVGETLVAGPQVPDIYYWADLGASKIHDELLLQADGGAATLTVSSTDANYAIITLQSSQNGGVGQANLNISNADSMTSDALNMQFNGITSAVFNVNGAAVGATYLAPAGGPVGYLEVYADGQADMANFYSVFDNSDNAVRVATAGANSTAGLVLQQSNADAVVGMRVGQTGNLTLHTGLNNGAELSDSSIVVTVDQSGRMGLGINAPQQRLDIDGGLQWNLPNTANVAVYAVDVLGVVIDSFTDSLVRSADYTVQCTAASGAVEITQLSVMHENGVAYQHIYSNLNSAGGGTGPTVLGTITASPNGNQIELIYSGAAPGNRVKVDATYITI